MNKEEYIDTILLENDRLYKENNQLKEQKKELRSWLEEHYDFSDCIRIKSVLDKLNELEGGKNE